MEIGLELIGEIVENDAILVDHFYFDGKYRPPAWRSLSLKLCNIYLRHNN